MISFTIGFCLLAGANLLSWRGFEFVFNPKDSTVDGILSGSSGLIEMRYQKKETIAYTCVLPLPVSI